MKEMLKSIFRMDEDQAARRIARKYFFVIDPDYYDIESKHGFPFLNHLSTLILQLHHAPCTISSPHFL